MNTAQEPVLAIFDFDGTLTTRSTTAAFLRHLFPLRFYCLSPLLLLVFFAFELGLCSIDSLNSVIAWAFFKRKNAASLYRRSESFCDNRLPKLLNAAGMQKLRFHQHQGHACYLATSAYGIYARIWALRQGFDGAVATEFELDKDGCFTGKLLGKSCYGPEKVRRLADTIACSTQIYAYGDSVGDRELLNTATHPFYRTF